MSNSYYSQFFYTKHKYPVMLDCSFKVAPADTGGLGITGLTGRGINAVYMHTSATAAATNPNPAAGEIMIQLNDSFASLLGVEANFYSPLAGSAGTSTTTNVINVITTLGTATVAQWVAVGLPPGITPAVGVSFVATSSAVIGGSAQVDLRATAGAGIDHLEVVGTSSANLQNSTIQNASLTQAAGGYIYLAAFKNTALTAPATGSILQISLYLSNFSKSTF